MSGTTTVMKSCEKMEVNGTEDEEPSYTHSEKHYTHNISETNTGQSIEYTEYHTHSTCSLFSTENKRGV